MTQWVEVLGVGMATLAIGGGILKRRARAAAMAAEPTCTGWFDTSFSARQQGCNALRSPLCSDGRCSFHCGNHCKCERNR